jgi:hypothetical protein
MKALIPISNTGDGHDLFEAFVRMFVRTAQLARKRPSPLSMDVPPACIDLVVLCDDIRKGITVEDAIKRIDSILS